MDKYFFKVLLDNGVVEYFSASRTLCFEEFPFSKNEIQSVIVSDYEGAKEWGNVHFQHIETSNPHFCVITLSPDTIRELIRDTRDLSEFRIMSTGLTLLVIDTGKYYPLEPALNNLNGTATIRHSDIEDIVPTRNIQLRVER